MDRSPSREELLARRRARRIAMQVKEEVDRIRNEKQAPKLLAFINSRLNGTIINGPNNTFVKVINIQRIENVQITAMVRGFNNKVWGESGHRVYCTTANDEEIEVDLYQIQNANKDLWKSIVADFKIE